MFQLAIRTAGAVVASCAVGGCGLISSDLTVVDLSIPDKTFTIDAAQWELQPEPSLREVRCDEQPTVCADVIASQCGSELCEGTCDGMYCSASLRIALSTEVDLLAEHPELANLDPVVAVTVHVASYEISDNSLSVASPPLMVYVAPATVMSPSDPQARLIGTIPSIAAGTRQPSTELDLDGEARAYLAEVLTDASTPFNLLVGANLELTAGDALPSGRLQVAVRIAATASL